MSQRARVEIYFKDVARLERVKADLREIRLAVGNNDEVTRAETIEFLLNEYEGEKQTAAG